MILLFMKQWSDELIQFHVTLDKDTKENEVIRQQVKQEIVPQLRECFKDFVKDLLQSKQVNLVHAKDVYIAPKASVQAYQPKPPVVSPVVVQPVKTGVVGALVTINQKVDFVCQASDLYVTLLDPGRVAVWTRGKAVIANKVGEEFKLFDGNVTGKIVELVENKKIGLTWRLKTWPTDHYSNVTIELNQGSESTELQLVQKDVPIGERDATEKNWRNYYWNSIKQAFGFGALL